MNIALDGLLIDNKKAGIGNYGLNLIEHLINNSDINFEAFLQDCVKLNYQNIYYRRSYKGSRDRIIDEQFFLPAKLKKYDLVHFIDYSSPVIRLKTPFIITIHDLSFYKFPGAFSKSSRMFKQFLVPISIRRANRIIADSQNTKNDIINLFPEAENKIRVIYPGRPDFKRIHNTDLINSVKKKYGICGEYILGVCTIEPRKNLERLVQAFEMISQKFSDTSLVLTGKKGWLYDDFFNRIKGSSIKNRIVITGYVEQQDLPYIYSGAKVFVYPSLYEGFGLPPLEGMCCGVPVIVSNTSSLPEVVGDAGVYCDPYSIESIADAITRVLSDEALKNHLSFEGIKRSHIFNWEDAASGVIDIYREILE